MARRLFLVFCLPFLMACGIQKTAEDTLSGVQQSNELQQKLLDQTQRMQELTQKLKELTEQVATGIHLQILDSALKGLLDPENTKILNPPFRMLPYAKTFAEEATEAEMIQTFHAFLQEVIHGPVEFESLRMISLVAMSALAAFTPESVVENLLKNQIESHDAYEESTITFAVCRNQFLRDVLFLPKIQASLIINKGVLKETVRYFRGIRQIATLPYVDRLKFSVLALGVDVQVDPDEVNPNVNGSLAEAAYRRFTGDTGLNAEVLMDPEVQELLANFK